MDSRITHPGLAEIADYYTGRLTEYGQTARGVDWNGSEGQILRFAQLAGIIDLEAGFSVNDLGCGYGALHDFLTARYSRVSYHGCDISAAMVGAARERCADTQATFIQACRPGRVADYGIASGIFNVRLHLDETTWQQHIEASLDILHETSHRGFAFNCLTRYSDPERMRPDLYYADPCALFDRCKRRYARDVALLHDYGLYEFTILVRKRA